MTREEREARWTRNARAASATALWLMDREPRRPIRCPGWLMVDADPGPEMSEDAFEICGSGAARASTGHRTFTR